MKRQSFLFLSVLLTAILLVFACPTTNTDEDTETNNGGDETTTYTTKKFVSIADGYVQFYTDDPVYSTTGKTVWLSGDVSQDTNTYNVEIETKKITGNQFAGYGLIFCVQEDINDFLMVQINTQGKYMIGKVTDKVSKTIQGWGESDLLKQNLNTTNTIKVKYNTGTGKFGLYINDDNDGDEDELECEFIDSDTSPYLSGKWGFIAEVSPLDALPYVPVEIVFKDLTP